jgi:hypothetical protein
MQHMPAQLNRTAQQTVPVLSRFMLRLTLDVAFNGVCVTVKTLTFAFTSLHA